MPSVKQFTKLGVEKLKLPSGAKQITYFQTMERGVSLMLVVGSTTKTWRCMTYDENGKAQSVKIGRFPQLQPDEARREARRLFENPEQRKAEASAEANKTFRQVAEDWLSREKKDHISRREDERYLGIELEPNPNKKSRRRTVYIPNTFLDRKIRGIERGDAVALLDQIEKNHGKVTADRIRGILARVMAFYQRRVGDRVYTSPMTPNMKRDKRKAKERRRKRVLLFDPEAKKNEIADVWKACEQAGQFGRFLQLCLLTVQRREKVSTMRWPDLNGNVWTIASKDREKGTAEVLVLPDMAMAIIAEQTKVRKEGNPYVFPGKGSKAMNAFSQGKAEMDGLLPADMPHWVIHDLRRTGRTLLSPLTRPDIAERIVGHEQDEGDIQTTYDLYDYRPEMTKALKALAGRIKGIVDPQPNVVPISKARRARNSAKQTSTGAPAPA